jgi:hypothetical protein
MEVFASVSRLELGQLRSFKVEFESAFIFLRCGGDRPGFHQQRLVEFVYERPADQSIDKGCCHEKDRQ